MNSGKLTFCLSVLWLGVVLPTSALAYIGPGAGLSAIGTFFAVIGAFFLLIVGFVWYPVKRLLRWFKAKKNADENGSADPKS
jgi:uncharacterized membrane protein YdjX (TVP38/TMEM64 family)